MTQNLVKSAARVFAVLELFDKSRRPLRLKDIATELDQPTSSVAALLKSMTAQGYLAFHTQLRTYMPTARLAKIVSWIPYEEFEQGPVMEALEFLQAESGETVLLAAQDGIHLVYVQALNANEGFQLRIPAGTRRLLVQTGTGWLLLNSRPRSDALSLYDQTIASGELDRRKFSRAAFLAALDDHATRTISFVRARDVVIPTAHWGGGMLSALIPVPRGHRPLALCIGGPAERLEAGMAKLEALLQTAIDRLEQALTRRD